ESITYYSNYPIRSTTPVTRCGDQFTWVAPYDFIKDDEKINERQLQIKFVGIDKFFNRDTAIVNVLVKQTINYPYRMMQYNKISDDIERYIVQLKNTFRSLDQKV